MQAFLQEVVEGKNFSLTLDTSIYTKDIILKAAYNFLDKGYFLFATDGDNIVLSFTAKEDSDTDPKIVIWEYCDELLDVHLRDKLEKDNRVIREAIVSKALSGPIDQGGYVTYNPDEVAEANPVQNEIDFDKDIDDILAEIENDPDLQIDQWEIDKILKEIEEEAAQEPAKPEIKINPENISALKDQFKK